jgi:hypothetical protein
VVDTTFPNARMCWRTSCGCRFDIVERVDFRQTSDLRTPSFMVLVAGRQVRTILREAIRRWFFMGVASDLFDRQPQSSSRPPYGARTILRRANGRGSGSRTLRHARSGRDRSSGRRNRMGVKPI